ncbi:MAG: cyclic nucleotide-binding domain-containing protein [Proteobacteria bacterium]|nr:cyclic nucleotide-binding domain-containing protein [Pseudomonadota bacterium]
MERFAKKYFEGEMIYGAGELSNNMFAILSGKVGIKKVGINNNGETTAILGEGAHFGELSMFLDEPRSENVVAMMDDTNLLVISKNNFETIIREHPLIVFNILKEMAFRMKTDR